MAVPEYENGRIVVPADSAYSNCEDGVYKASIPFVNNVDVTKYCDIPDQVDYFFNIPKEEPKYIANFNQDGYGLLHISTSRLQSRKLFTWGHNDGSDSWQEFLTKDAGKYVEIQAGLGKTQYGCIPMAPNTSWEWMEHYGAINVDAAIATKPYEEAVTEITEIVNTHLADYRLEAYLKETRPMAKTEGKLLYHGSGYGSFANELRNHNGEKELSPQLAFTDELGTYDTWKEFLKTGILNTPDINERPNDFVCDETLHQLLLDTIENKNAESWYAHYQLGLSYYQKENFAAAKAELLASYNCAHNPWALHGLAALALRNGNKAEASDYILEGYSFRKEDLSYLKETWKILLLADAYDKLLTIYETLPENFQNESRIYFGYLMALGRTGREKEAFEILTGDTPLELVDLRECEDTLGALYKELHKKIYGTEGTVPHVYNFYSL